MRKRNENSRHNFKFEGVLEWKLRQYNQESEKIKNKILNKIVKKV